MMDRRAFLRRLGFGTVAAAAAAIGVFDVEKLLWIPGEKTIVIPAPVVHYNTLITPDWVTREVLRTVEKQLAFVRLDHFSFIPLVGHVRIPLAAVAKGCKVL